MRRKFVELLIRTESKTHGIFTFCFVHKLIAYIHAHGNCVRISWFSFHLRAYFCFSYAHIELCARQDCGYRTQQQTLVCIVFIWWNIQCQCIIVAIHTQHKPCYVSTILRSTNTNTVRTFCVTAIWLLRVMKFLCMVYNTIDAIATETQKKNGKFELTRKKSTNILEATTLF